MKELLVNKLLREQLLRIFGLPIDRRAYLGLNIYSFCIHTSKIAHFNRIAEESNRPILQTTSS